MPLVARGGSLLVGSDGNLTTNEDCCCGEATCCATRRVTSFTITGIVGSCYAPTNGTYLVTEHSCGTLVVLDESFGVPSSPESGGCAGSGSCGPSAYHLVQRTITIDLSNVLGSPSTLVTVRWRFRHFDPDGIESPGPPTAVTANYNRNTCETITLDDPTGGIATGCFQFVGSFGTCSVVIEDI